MTVTIPTCEPSRLVAGDTWQWDIVVPEFPATSSQCSYRFVSQSSDDQFTAAWGTHVTAEGSVFEVRIPTSVTTLRKAGVYLLTRRVTDGTYTRTDGPWRVRVDANPATATGAKSFNRQMLEALQAASLEDEGSGGVWASIAVNSRTITYRTQEEYTNAVARFDLLVTLEENPDVTLATAAEFVRG